jgi:hypothetical protein
MAESQPKISANFKSNSESLQTLSEELRKSLFVKKSEFKKSLLTVPLRSEVKI